MARYVGSIAIIPELLLRRRRPPVTGARKVWWSDTKRSHDSKRLHDWCGLFDLERKRLDHYDSVSGARKAVAVRRPTQGSMGVPQIRQVRTINVTCSRTTRPRLVRSQWQTMTASAKATRAVPARPSLPRRGQIGRAHV